jgi:hypothetical protein
MKRHEALHPLSHDHQNALARALRLRRVRDSGEDARRAERTSFVEFANTRLLPHFEEEERLLERAAELAPASTALQAARDRMDVEHAAFRAEFARLERDADVPNGNVLYLLGEQLTAHIRFEERELFQLLQHELGDQLTDLVDA